MIVVGWRGRGGFDVEVQGAEEGLVEDQFVSKGR
jgi:hypothetical protein